MNPTATKSTRTVCHHRCILPSNTTVAFLSHSTGTTTQRSANPTLLALGFSPSIRHQDKVSMGRLWIYHSISSFLMMAPLAWYCPPTCPPSSPRMPRSSDSTHLLPPFLQPSCKITYDHEGQLHKGFLGQYQDGVFLFSFKSHINKKSEDWGVPLPNLTTTWQELCMEGVLIPGHQSSSFLSPRPSASRDDARQGGSVALPWRCRRRGQRRRRRRGRRTQRISIAAGVVVASTGGGDGGVHHRPCRRDEDARVIVNVDGAAVPVAV